MQSVACCFSSLDGLRQGTREPIKSHGCGHHPHHSTAESVDELKSPLMRVKEQSEKSGLKVNAKKTMMEGMTEDEMVGWPHQLNGHEFEQLQKTVKDREAWPAAVHGVTVRHH